MRNFVQKRLTAAVFLDETKAFGIIWIVGPLYKLPFLKFLHSL